MTHGDLNQLIGELIYQGRERRALNKAERSMANRLLAYLHSMYNAIEKNPDYIKRYESQKTLEIAKLPAFLAKPYKDSGIDASDWKERALLILGASPSAQMMLEAGTRFSTQAAYREKNIRKTAEQLPICKWIKTVDGISPLGLGLIICETDNLSNYPHHRPLWKRMGLAVYEDKAQRRAKGVDMGFNAERRMVAWNTGVGFVKKGTFYRQVYLDRKAYERERNAEMSKLHAHNRAMRYATKLFLRELWSVWVGMHGVVEPPISVVE